MGIPHRDRARSRRGAVAGACAMLTAATLSCRLPTRPPGTPEFRVAPSPTPSLAPPETSLPTLALPRETPTVTPTATVPPTSTLGPPLFTTTTNANCRTGPGLVYDIVRVVMAGTSEPIVGRDAASTWWVIQGGVRCWISNVTGTASGDLSEVPVIPAPPTPTPSPTATSTITPTPTLHIIIPPTSILRTIVIPPRVSAANVSVDGTLCMPCPCEATWIGWITATGPLTAEYIWEYRYGSGAWLEASTMHTLTFSEAGTRNAGTYGMGHPGPSAQTVSVRLHVTSPNEVYSNEVSVRYCAP